MPGDAVYHILARGNDLSKGACDDSEGFLSFVHTSFEKNSAIPIFYDGCPSDMTKTGKCFRFFYGPILAGDKARPNDAESR